MPFDQLRFSVPEILSLIGLTQCVYVLVYMLFRSGDVKRAVLPFCYFFVLGTAFFLDFSQRYIGDFVSYYDLWQWASWFMGPPLSVLLIVQVAQITRAPLLRHYGVLLFLPAAFMAAFALAQGHDRAAIHEWLIVTGLFAGALSMLSIWMNRNLMGDLHREKAGKDRYWLILTLIFINLFFLGTMLMSLSPVLSAGNAGIIRTFLGLGLVYLAGTSLFRIYPQAVQIIVREQKAMTKAENALAVQIECLLDREKVYHEASYSRTELARELKVPENVVSKVVNVHFGKTFPQLLNERRVEDAKRLLLETDESIKVIAQESGFNSIASFNRVFRDQTSVTAGAYRKRFSKAL